MIEIITGKRKRRESLVFSGLTVVLYVTIMPPGDRGFRSAEEPGAHGRVRAAVGG